MFNKKATVYFIAFLYSHSSTVARMPVCHSGDNVFNMLGILNKIVMGSLVFSAGVPGNGLGCKGSQYDNDHTTH